MLYHKRPLRNKNMIKWIITGTGRCGTVYMARVLTEWGIPCGHESVFTVDNLKIILGRLFGYHIPDSSVCSDNRGWVNVRRIEADSSYMATPYLGYPDIENIPVLHLVRNPLAVVSSFVKDMNYFSAVKDNPFNVKGWEQWIYSKMPELKNVPRGLERACCYYVGWNKKIEKINGTRPYLLHRIEDDFSDNFFDFFKITKQPVLFKNKKINTMKKTDRDNFKIEDIPDGEVKDSFLEMMSKYGY